MMAKFLSDRNAVKPLFQYIHAAWRFTKSYQDLTVPGDEGTDAP